MFRPIEKILKTDWERTKTSFEDEEKTDQKRDKKRQKNVKKVKKVDFKEFLTKVDGEKNGET